MWRKICDLRRHNVRKDKEGMKLSMIKKAKLIIISILMIFFLQYVIGLKSVSAVSNDFSRIKTLYELAVNFKSENEVEDSANDLCLQYIRRNKYNTSTWQLTAGTINSDFVSYIENNDEDLSKYDFSKMQVIDEITGEDVDFVHLCATLNAITKNKSVTLELPSFAGWVGDLTTLMEQVVIYDDGKTDEELQEYANKLMASKDSKLNSTFDINDALADLDAVNLYNNYLISDKSLYEAISEYYSNSKFVTNRKGYFADNFGGKDNIKTFVTNMFAGYVGNMCIKNIMNQANFVKYSANTSKYTNFAVLAFDNYMNSNEIVKIEVNKLPNKTSYKQGENLDLAGGTINAVFEDGTKKEIEMLDEEAQVKFEGYDKTKIGKQEITITYKDKKTSFSVEVTENIKEEPKKDDDTVAKTPIPQTGINSMITLILVATIISSILYIKYKKYEIKK